MAQERQGISLKQHEEELRFVLENINKQKSSEWALKIASFLNQEGRGRWLMKRTEHGCEMEYGRYLRGFRIFFKPGETHIVSGAVFNLCGQLEEVVIVEKSSEERSLLLMLANRQNVKFLIGETGDLCLCLYERKINGAPNTH